MSNDAQNERAGGEITWGEFERVELRVGTILDVETFPEARQPAWKLRIDFGETVGVLKSSAQITTLLRFAALSESVLCISRRRNCSGVVPQDPDHRYH